MNRSKVVYFSLFISIIVLVSCSFAWAEESLSITAYYPSPYGVYNEMRLFPHAAPVTPCDAANEGTLFYNLTAGDLQVCQGADGWGGTSSFWASSGNDIYNTNTNNVGIGTNVPGAKLEVKGSVLFNGTVEGAGPDAINIPNSDILVGGGADGTFGIRTQDKAAPPAKRIITFCSENCPAGSWPLVIDNLNRRVGLRTITPQSILHIYGDPEIKLQSDSNPSNYSDMHLDNTLAGGREYVVGNYGPVIGWNPALQNSFFIRDNAGGDRFIIDSNGYVGIGTPDPRATLDVVGDEVIIEDGSPEINFIDSDAGDLNWRIGGGTGGYLAFAPTSEADWETGFGAGSIMILRYMSGVNRTYIGIGMWNPAHVLDLNGGAYCDGTGAWVDGSDRAYKKDIDYNFQYGLQTIGQLKPVYYVHKEDGMNKKQIGFIAQDVKEVIPEVVDGEEGTYGLAYDRFVPVLVKAIKEQQKQIEDCKRQTIEQEKQVEELKAQIMGLKRK